MGCRGMDSVVQPVAGIRQHQRIVECFPFLDAPSAVRSGRPGGSAASPAGTIRPAAEYGAEWRRYRSVDRRSSPVSAAPGESRDHFAVATSHLRLCPRIPKLSLDVTRKLMPWPGVVFLTEAASNRGGSSCVWAASGRHCWHGGGQGHDHRTGRPASHLRRLRNGSRRHNALSHCRQRSQAPHRSEDRSRAHETQAGSAVRTAEKSEVQRRRPPAHGDTLTLLTVDFGRRRGYSGARIIVHAFSIVSRMTSNDQKPELDITWEHWPSGSPRRQAMGRHCGTGHRLAKGPEDYCRLGEVGRRVSRDAAGLVSNRESAGESLAVARADAASRDAIP